MDKDIKYYVDIHFYFRVHDSWVFGGEGSVGYMSSNFGGCTCVSDQKVKSAYEKVVDNLAKQLEVDTSKIECISKDEYDRDDEEDEVD